MRGSPRQPADESRARVPSSSGVATDRALGSALRTFADADDPRALRQVATSLGLFLISWLLAYQSLDRGFGLWLVFASLSGVMLLRLFILQHDLGHGALFRSQRTNEVVGSLLGLLTLVPFFYWRRLHNDHHRHSGDLEHRGPGCVTVLTVDEYLALCPRKRFVYRIHRNVVFTLLFGAPLYFLVLQRWPFDAPRSWTRERRSVLLTNLGALALILCASRLIGFQSLWMVHLPVVLVASSTAVWIFLNQHLFADTYWERDESWNFTSAGLEGSSYYKLPRILQWLTANVGFHHVHHLNPRIPNYRLTEAHDALPSSTRVKALTPRQSLQVFRLALWDEERGKLIGFGDIPSPHPSPSRRVSSEADG